MNDMDYDAMQKKRIARGAMNKKGGSKSKKCTLPSDYLSKKEREALNGPVTEINLNQPMDWKTFKGLSDTLKREYIEFLRETYQANTAMLGKMFGVVDVTARAELIRLGFSTKRKDRSTRGRAFEAKQAAWSAFCNGVVGGGDQAMQNAEWEVDGEKLADALEEAQQIAEAERELRYEEAKRNCAYSARPRSEKIALEEAPKNPESHPSRMDMTFDGFPDELTMTILRNMFREKNVKVRISAEVI